MMITAGVSFFPEKKSLLRWFKIAEKFIGGAGEGKMLVVCDDKEDARCMR